MLTTFPTPLQQPSEAPAGCPTFHSVPTLVSQRVNTVSMGEGLVHKTGPTTDASGPSHPQSPTTPRYDLLEQLAEQESDCQSAFRNDQIKALSGSLGPIKVHGAQWCYPEIASVHYLLNFMS